MRQNAITGVDIPKYIEYIGFIRERTYSLLGDTIMIKDTFLIHSAYGFVGRYGREEYQLVSTGLGVWEIVHDGSPDGMRQAFDGARSNSPAVQTVNDYLNRHCIPLEYARWLEFSVIEKFPSETI
jgi:hypothetical protein